MHELGLCEAIVGEVERRAGGRRVTRVRLRIGVLHRVDGVALDQAFAMLAAGTPAEHAEVEAVTVPVRAACRACGHRGDSQDYLPVCARCGSADVELSGGDELVLESIQVEEPG